MAILLVLEMTNSFSNIYAIGTVTIVAYLVADLLKEPPIYDSLLQAMLIPSSNDAALILANHISESSELFAVLMK